MPVRCMTYIHHDTKSRSVTKRSTELYKELERTIALMLHNAALQIYQKDTQKWQARVLEYH